VTVEPDVQRAARSAARLAKALEVALADIGTSLPQYRLLAFLSGGPERATALAGMLEVSPPTLTALVDGTVAKGLVERQTTEADRRCVRHVLTRPGEDLLSAADGAAAAKLTELMGPLDDADKVKVIEALGLVGDAIDAFHVARKDAVAR
jgi:long-chain acyl-CoA synthetase